MTHPSVQPRERDVGRGSDRGTAARRRWSRRGRLLQSIPTTPAGSRPASRQGGAVARRRGCVGPVRLTRTFAQGSRQGEARRQRGESIPVPVGSDRGFFVPGRRSPIRAAAPSRPSVGGD
jgi:hypothetical protein